MRVAATVVDGPDASLNEHVRTVGLVDHHTHSIVRGALSDEEFLLTVIETDRAAVADAAGLDTQVGVSIRRWCAPLLGLPMSAPADEYLAARRSRPNVDIAAILLPRAGFDRLIVETGYRGDELVAADELGRLAGAATSTVVRLEAVAETVAAGDPTAKGFATAYRSALHQALRGAVGVKTIVAYRHGLDFDPAPPTESDVARAAGAWLGATASGGSAAPTRPRLEDETLLRFVIWEGVRLGLPLQVHTGFGDPDLDLRRADPLLLGPFIRATEGRCPILLLHTYPFQRNAGYLAQMFPHVYLDVGLAVNYVGARAEAVVAESLELAPFHKVLFSSDAWGAPELHLLGSWLFRRALARVLGRWVADGDWSRRDAERLVERVSAENAREVYRL